MFSWVWSHAAIFAAKHGFFCNTWTMAWHCVVSSCAAASLWAFPVRRGLGKRLAYAIRSFSFTLKSSVTPTTSGRQGGASTNAESSEPLFFGSGVKGANARHALVTLDDDMAPGPALLDTWPP